MENVIVTGGLGYIGSVVCEELKKAGYNPIIIDNDLYNLNNSCDKFINCDILNKKKINEVFKKYAKTSNSIINLAAIVGDPACLVNTKKSLEINCTGTRNIVEFANKYNFKVFHASTCSLYGAERCSLNSQLTEKSYTFPMDFYGQTKYQQERFVTELGKRFCIFRLATAYGVSKRMRYDLVINLFAAKAANNEPITVFGGEQYRPFIHVKDISRAFVHSIEKDLEGIYNLAEINSSILELTDIIKKISGSKIEISNMIHDPRNYIVNNKKFFNSGFKFKWNIERGIKELIKFSRGMNYKDRVYDNKKLMESIF